MHMERGGDIETLVQQGHGTVSNGDVFKLYARNMTGTNPLRLYTVNARLTVTSQDSLSQIGG